MRSTTARLVVALATMALIVSACASKKSVNTATASPTPTTQIGSCVTNAGNQQPTPAKGVDFHTQLKEAGVLNIGSDNDYAPFESIPPGQKTPVGFDVDLYKEVVKRLGITAKSTTTSFDGLFTSSLPTGQFDVGVSAITIKEERKRNVDFTIPYFVANLSLAVNITKNPGIHSIDDLVGKTIGVQNGTTSEDCAKALVAQGKAKDVKSYDSGTPNFDDLVAGRIDAIINDTPASVGFLAGRPTIRIVQIIETNEKYGFAVGKQKPDLREAINAKLRDIMTDGTYATIYKTWFKTAPPFKVPIG